MPLDIEELEPTTRNDYRRANGAPMVLVDGKNERYSRPSSFAKPLDDESALVNWKIDRGCAGVAGDRALQARWCAIDLDSADDREDKKKLREDSISAGRGAEKADIGTALHAMSVRFEQDMSFSPPQPYLDSLQAYMNEMTRRTEFHTVNRQYRCAGTADRLYELGSPLVTPTGEILPVGTLVIADLKTGEKLEYSKPAYAVQTFLYASGEFYDVLTDEFLATPPINQQWGIVVHMPAEFPGTCEFLWVDLEVGAHGAYIVQMVKTWRKMWRSGEFDMPLVQMVDGPTCFCGRPDDPAVTHQTNAPCYVLTDLLDDLPPHGLANRVETVTTILDEPAAVPSAPVEGSGLIELEAWIGWVRERVAQIGTHHPAKQALMQQWPEGVAVPKNMINMAEVDRVIPLLNKIEADYELGFVPKPAAILGDGPSTRKGRK
jgi:hypothetical protein